MHIMTEPLTEVPGIAITIDSENLDAGNAKDFRDKIQPHPDQHALIIIEMQAIKSVDSSGLSAMLYCLRNMNNKQGQLKLAGLTKPVRALFELVGMHRIFSIYNTREEALASL